jgi:MFS family permease
VHSHLLLLYAARALRGFGDGFAAIVLPVYLSAVGFDTAQIGLVAAAALLGTAAFTLAVGFIAPRYDLRSLLLVGAILMACTGFVFPTVDNIGLIVAVAFVGTINPSSGDIGVLIPIEHAMLTQGVADFERTHAFARYSLTGALSMAAGALAAAAPDFLVSTGLAPLSALKVMFYAYGVLGIASALVYYLLLRGHVEQRAATAPLNTSRRMWCTSSRPCSVWMLSPAALSSSLCSRFGCSNVSKYRSPQPACSFSGQVYSAHFPIRWPRASPNTSVW